MKIINKSVVVYLRTIDRNWFLIENQKITDTGSLNAGYYHGRAVKNTHLSPGDHIFLDDNGPTLSPKVAKVDEILKKEA